MQVFMCVIIRPDLYDRIAVSPLAYAEQSLQLEPDVNSGVSEL